MIEQNESSCFFQDGFVTCDKHAFTLLEWLRGENYLPILRKIYLRTAGFSSKTMRCTNWCNSCCRNYQGQRDALRKGLHLTRSEISTDYYHHRTTYMYNLTAVLRYSIWLWIWCAKKEKGLLAVNLGAHWIILSDYERGFIFGISSTIVMVCHTERLDCIRNHDHLDYHSDYFLHYWICFISLIEGNIIDYCYITVHTAKWLSDNELYWSYFYRHGGKDMKP